MNMREKMARAMYEGMGWRQNDLLAENRELLGLAPLTFPPFADADPYLRETYLLQAQAALDALMEPTEGMALAGWPWTHGDEAYPEDGEIRNAKHCFQAMIRAAKEGK